MSKNAPGIVVTMSESMLTLPDAAELLAISVKSIRHHITYNGFPVVRVGRNLRTTRTAVAAWVQAQNLDAEVAA